MTESQILFQLTEKCEIFFEDSLISKELIIQRYSDFLAASISPEQRLSSVALHTGSLCFDIITIIMATLACVAMDETEADDIIADLQIGDMVVFKDERYRWDGLKTQNDKLYFVLKQDRRGEHGGLESSYLYDTNRNFVKPYYGNSDVTDGRGIKKQRSNRSDFISYIIGKTISEIPAITKNSVVIVANRALFERIQKGLRIDYNGKSIRLPDIVPASYYTDVNKSQQFGSNPSKAEPVQKITGKVSVARDLILEKSGNTPVGLVVLGSEFAAKGSSELDDLLSRKSLKFTHMSMSIDSVNADNAEQYVSEDDNSAIFACTTEFLLHNSTPSIESNPHTLELDKQIENILNNEVISDVIEGGCPSDVYREIKDTLYFLRESDWDENKKRSFVVSSYSLLNMLTTAVFSMASFESAFVNGELQPSVASPAGKIQELMKTAEKSGAFELQCSFVSCALDDLYKSIQYESPKYRKLRELVTNSFAKRIAIIVPKAYYADILRKDRLFSDKQIEIVTANRFDANQSYDKIIVIGDFFGKRFDALRCRSSADIVVLLYECETYRFGTRRRKYIKFEKKLNAISGLCDDPNEIDVVGVEADKKEKYFEDITLNLEEYIDRISSFNVPGFAAGANVSDGAAQTSEIKAIGRFTNNDHILFSKYFKAVVFDPSNDKKPISETDVDKLTVGDRLVFTKRDDFTRNVVDKIFEVLQMSGKLSKEVLAATEKAQWWKEVLRDYKQRNDLSYKQLGEELKSYGCTVQEQGIRQWLLPDSHIVGPRDEATLRQIAEMTGDPYLLHDVSGYHRACKRVRKQRRRILKLIGIATADKLSGSQPQHGGELEIVYDNVENLSEILELEAIEFLDESDSVPINFINRPITDMEVTL